MANIRTEVISVILGVITTVGMGFGLYGTFTADNARQRLLTRLWLVQPDLQVQRVQRVLTVLTVQPVQQVLLVLLVQRVLLVLQVLMEHLLQPLTLLVAMRFYQHTAQIMQMLETQKQGRI